MRPGKSVCLRTISHAVPEVGLHLSGTMTHVKPEMGPLVRLGRRPQSGVQVPVRRNVHRPGTEGDCVVATRGGERPEVNDPSVTT